MNQMVSVGDDTLLTVDDNKMATINTVDHQQPVPSPSSSASSVSVSISGSTTAAVADTATTTTTTTAATNNLTSNNDNNNNNNSSTKTTSSAGDSGNGDSGSGSGDGDKQNYHLRFNAYTSSLSRSLLALLSESHCTDVYLSTGYHSQTIRAHRLILSAFSPYFKSIFASLPSSQSFPVIIFSNISYDILCAIVEFCYRGEISVPYDKLNDIVTAARFLEIEGAKDFDTSSCLEQEGGNGSNGGGDGDGPQTDDESVKSLKQQTASSTANNQPRPLAWIGTRGLMMECEPVRMSFTPPIDMIPASPDSISSFHSSDDSYDSTRSSSNSNSISISKMKHIKPTILVNGTSAELVADCFADDDSRPINLSQVIVANKHNKHKLKRKFLCKKRQLISMNGALDDGDGNDGDCDDDDGGGVHSKKVCIKAIKVSHHEVDCCKNAATTFGASSLSNNCHPHTTAASQTVNGSGDVEDTTTSQQHGQQGLGPQQQQQTSKQSSGQDGHEQEVNRNIKKALQNTTIITNGVSGGGGGDGSGGNELFNNESTTTINVVDDNHTKSHTDHQVIRSDAKTENDNVVIVNQNSSKCLLLKIKAGKIVKQDNDSQEKLLNDQESNAMMEADDEVDIDVMHDVEDDAEDDDEEEDDYMNHRSSNIEHQQEIRDLSMKSHQMNQESVTIRPVVTAVAATIVNNNNNKQTIKREEELIPNESISKDYFFYDQIQQNQAEQDLSALLSGQSQALNSNNSNKPTSRIEAAAAAAAAARLQIMQMYALRNATNQSELPVSGANLLESAANATADSLVNSASTQLSSATARAIAASAFASFHANLGSSSTELDQESFLANFGSPNSANNISNCADLSITPTNGSGGGGGGLSVSTLLSAAAAAAASGYPFNSNLFMSAAAAAAVNHTNSFISGATPPTAMGTNSLVFHNGTEKRGRGRPPKYGSLYQAPSTPTPPLSVSSQLSASAASNATASSKSKLPLMTSSSCSSSSSSQSSSPALSSPATSTSQHHHHHPHSHHQQQQSGQQQMTTTNNGPNATISSHRSRRGRPPSVPDEHNQTRTHAGRTDKAHHKCPHCPQIYYGYHAMRDHITSVHLNSGEKYTCHICHKEYTWRITLRKHLKCAHGVHPDQVGVSSFAQTMQSSLDTPHNLKVQI